VESYPAQLFSDTIVDACLRVVRFHDRLAQSQDILMRLAQAQQASQVGQHLRGLMGPDGQRIR
jgi:hypothetical protein